MDHPVLILCVKGIMIGGIYALVSLGFNIIYRTTGILNFAQGEFVMIGGVVSAWAAARWGCPLAVAGLAGVLAAGLAGLAVDALAIRPVRRAAPVVAIIVTVGVSIVLRALVALTLGTEPFHLEPLQAGSFRLAGVPVEYQSLWMSAAAAVCMVLTALFFKTTTAGRAMRACADNPEAARLCGVNPGRMSAAAFGISAALAGMAGVLVTPMISMRFDQGTMMGLKGFSAAILGGLGNPAGGVASGLLLGVLEQGAAWGSSAYKETAALSLVIIVLLARPKGLFTR